MGNPLLAWGSSVSIRFISSGPWVKKSTSTDNAHALDLGSDPSCSVSTRGSALQSAEACVLSHVMEDQAGIHLNHLKLARAVGPCFGRPDDQDCNNSGGEPEGAFRAREVCGSLIDDHQEEGLCLSFTSKIPCTQASLWTPLPSDVDKVCWLQS